MSLSASSGNGNSKSKDVHNQTSHINAGQRATLISGHDTTLRGAQVIGDQISAQVGHDLRIESLQDTSVYKSKDKSVSGGVSVGLSNGGSSGTAGTTQSRIRSDYAAVSATELY